MSPATTTITSIPFNRCLPVGREREYVAEALESGILAGDGRFTRACHNWLRRHLGVHGALLTTSGTHALEMTALLLNLEPGDEVIVPSFTFVSSINAYVLCGAKPVFADIRPDTLNLDERRLSSLITPRTKAIVVVHYAGVGCEMDSILSIANSAGISVIEDNAHGLFGRYKGKYLGTFGFMAAQSFHETKNIACGEGGALLLNDPALVDRAEILREKGTDRSKFFRGQVDKYNWVDLGSSYLPSELNAAFLLGQFEMRDVIQSQRRNIWETYYAELAAWAASNGVRLPFIPDHCEQPYHMFYLLMPTLERRQAFIAHMKARGITTPFHYVPLHSSPMGRRLGGRTEDCPVTERISDQLVRMPLFNTMSGEELETVIEAVREFRY
ncbi:MAG: dTDP-4-amino-4,6-dideoxygalactose transaminase [Terriglobia bacterium]|jgi:dTDP-4-amino-4,6-dideoxygalactose transaminase|nr:dTDP-4-amino-4,6-dideoxygalactose transaminase [Terriglobia bacterium]